MTLTIHLDSHGPTDLARSNQPVTENREDRKAYLNGILYRVSRIDGTPVLIRARSAADDSIQFDLAPAGADPLPARQVLETALRRKFSLDLDLPAFYRFVSQIPQLAHLPAQQAGLRPLLKDSLLETLCLAIADQQVNVAFAANLKHQLLQTYGTCFQVDGLALWLFPPRHVLAALDLQALRRLQFTRNKSSYIVGLARQFSTESHWEGLTTAGSATVPEAGQDRREPVTDEDIVTQLCTLRGVGRWTAEYAALSGLGRVDTLPAADIALMRMVQQVYGLPERPDENKVREIAAAWTPWRGLVTFYLWHLEDTQD